ncbi:MAG: tRNA-dihydrouridine synthase, partial [Nocardioidaceae bacterium]
SDWIDGGWAVRDTAELTKRLGDRGVDFVDVSSGGLSAKQEIAIGPGYQVPFAHEIRELSGVPTGAVGLITDPAQAEQVLADGSADAVLLARAALREPAWPLRAAHELDIPAEDAPYPKQYTRGAWH